MKAFRGQLRCRLTFIGYTLAPSSRDYPNIVVNRLRKISILAGLCLAVSVFGCSVRETHTPRTSTEQFLLSRAAQRAVSSFKEGTAIVRNKRVYVDSSLFESYDKEYVIGAIRHQLVESGAFLVPKDPQEYEIKGKKVKLGPEYVVEVRAAALGNRENNFGFGTPHLPVPIPQTPVTTHTKPLYVINRRKQEGWAKFQLWIYNAETDEYVAQSKDLWGKAYYSQWWFFLLGPFDFSNDIYPDENVVGKNRYPGIYDKKEGAKTNSLYGQEADQNGLKPMDKEGEGDSKKAEKPPAKDDAKAPEKSEKTEAPKEDAKPTESEPKKDPAATDPAKTDPAKTDSAETEPKKTDPAKADPAKADPAKEAPKETPAKEEPKKDGE